MHTKPSQLRFVNEAHEPGVSRRSNALVKFPIVCNGVARIIEHSTVNIGGIRDVE